MITAFLNWILAGETVVSIWQMIISVIALALFAHYCRFTRSKKYRLMSEIPGLSEVPIIGNTLEANVQHDELFTRLTGTTLLWGGSEGVWKAWMGYRPYVFINKAPAAEAILGSYKHIEKSYEYSFLYPWLATGLLTSSGNKWVRRRKIITPAFHFKILDDFIEIFQEQSEILIEKLAPLADGESIFNLLPYITLCALDIVCETAMGLQINAQNCNDSEYVKAVYGMSEIVQSRQAKVWLQPECFFRLSSLYKEHEKHIKVLHDFSTKVIEERKRELKVNHSKPTDTDETVDLGRKKRLAFLDLLIQSSENGNALSTEDIREEVDTFMFEGHDTTSAAMAWCLFLLGLHQDIQDEVIKELDGIFGDTTRSVSLRDLQEMKYLERCIKESLRLYPSVPIIGRIVGEDVKIGRYTVPKGTTAMIVLYQLQRDPSIYASPERFNPDRFLSECTAGRHPYAYLPFSAGPRNCIGQKFAMLEEKVVISSVLRKFRIEAMDKREDLTLLGELILRPKNGLRVKLTPRF